MSRGTKWLLPALLLASGCTCHLSTVPPVEMDLAEALCSVGQQSRCHVYLFFVQGLDPIDCANLEDLKEMTQALGFPNAWYGNCYYLKTFKKEIAHLHSDDEKARFVIVGYGMGVDSAHELAKTVGAQGITIDLMVCVGKKTDPLGSVARLVHVLPNGNNCTCVRTVGDIHYVMEKKHNLPTCKETVELVAQELLGLSAHIPSETDLPQMIYPDHEPTPRPVMPPADKAQRDDWDFLKPASVDRHNMIPPDTVPEYRPRKKNEQAKASKLLGKNAR